VRRFVRAARAIPAKSVLLPIGSPQLAHGRCVHERRVQPHAERTAWRERDRPLALHSSPVERARRCCGDRCWLVSRLTPAAIASVHRAVARVRISRSAWFPFSSAISAGTPLRLRVPFSQPSRPFCEVDGKLERRMRSWSKRDTMLQLALQSGSGRSPQTTDARRARGEELQGERTLLRGQPL
jgi:hypothetical protein